VVERGGRRGAGELEAVGDELADNTVRTIVTRLTAKGLVERATRGRAPRWPNYSRPRERLAADDLSSGMTAVRCAR
jgi:predicted transcriptional regulator